MLVDLKELENKMQQLKQNKEELEKALKQSTNFGKSSLDDMDSILDDFC